MFEHDVVLCLLLLLLLLLPNIHGTSFSGLVQVRFGGGGGRYGDHCGNFVAIGIAIDGDDEDDDNNKEDEVVLNRDLVSSFRKGDGWIGKYIIARNKVNSVPRTTSNNNNGVETERVYIRWGNFGIMVNLVMVVSLLGMMIPPLGTSLVLQLLLLFMRS